MWKDIHFGTFCRGSGVQFKKIVPSDLASIYVHEARKKSESSSMRRVRWLRVSYSLMNWMRFCPSRCDGVNPNAASEVNEFLAQMGNCSEAGVFIMGATNRPKLIDPAVLQATVWTKRCASPA